MTTETVIKYIIKDVHDAQIDEYDTLDEAREAVDFDKDQYIESLKEK